VVGIRSLHTVHLGPNQILIVLGIHFAEDLSAPAIEDVVARLERRVTDRPSRDDRCSIDRHRARVVSRRAADEEVLTR
jgi:hypothetical protein